MRRLFLALVLAGLGLAFTEAPRYRTIAFPEGEPSTLAWDPGHDTLYVADNEGNRIWRWTEKGGLADAAHTPDALGALAAQATLVGQIVHLADGTLVVPRFGKPGGPFGGIVFVNPALGSSGVVPGLDPARKRLGLTVAADGRLYGSYFTGGSGGGQAGAVTRVDLRQGEADMATGFRKIVGLLAVGDTLYVSDQQADAIYALPLKGPLPAPGRARVLARLARPDQLAPGPDGSLFTGQFQAAPGSDAPLAVRQVWPDGRVTVFAQDPDVSRPGGLAYDPKDRRLFVANSGNVAGRSVRIFPVP